MVTLVIMDGFGYNKNKHGNAIAMQGTPKLKKLKTMFKHTLINASGEHVGLSIGQMGNSEVGHLNLGAGRVVYQDLTKINHLIETGEFFNNEELISAINHAKNNNSNLHIMGLCSDGGVHSHINHLKALIKLSNSLNFYNIYLHLFLDGRDTSVRSGVDFVSSIETYCNSGQKAKLASLCGRVYAMDREKRYERVQKAYNMLVYGESDGDVKNLTDAFADSYSDGVYDEFFEPTKLTDFKEISDGDSVIFFNFRTDRARELTQAFTDSSFKEFKVEKFKNLKFTTFTEYDEKFKNVNVAFKNEKIEDNLSKIIADSGLKQFHISETTKYAHVTFFFNGGIEQPNKNEDRKLIESEDVLDFAVSPKMKAYEITNAVLEAIVDKKYDFILVNLSNADMIGHTGNLNAAIEAIEAVDKCAYAIALATLATDGDCIITADHGNAEEMLTRAGEKITSHTTNPVPFILATNNHKKIKLIKDGRLSNIAPTVLKLLGLDIPSSMDKPMF